MYCVLFVCTGNICRSATAEGVFRHMVTEADLAHRIGVDSVGTHDFHIGEPPDRRALQAGRSRGYEFGDLRARQLGMQDFVDFHLILAMHRDHFHRLIRRCPPGAEKKLAMFLDAAPESGLMDVPDPRDGSPDAFEQTLDLIESGSRGWLNAIRAVLTEIPGQPVSGYSTSGV